MSLSDDALVATTFLSRLRGLLFRSPLAAGQGLYIEPCSAIHMFGMTYSIDAVFLDSDWQVVGLVERLQPGAVSGLFRRARGCLEVPEGTISRTGTRLGDRIEVS